MLGAKCQFCAFNTFRENVWTNRQTNKQTNKLDQSQDIVTGNANPQVDLRRGMSFSNIKISFLAT